MADHAKLSASSSHKWLNCTPSVRLEESFENKTSTFAEEGTAAHALSEHKLRRFLKIKTKKPISKYDSQELEFYTDAYVDYVCELIAEAKTRSNDSLALVEQRLDYSHYAPEGFGTGDLVIVSDGILDVIDLKYGKGVRVSAERNTQMMLYALGALDIFYLLYDIETVRLTICQPRLDNISTFELTVDELMQWAETELKPKAALAFRGEGDYISGEHCRFCRAKAKCRALAEANLELAKYEFKQSALLTDVEVADILTKADDLSKWASAVWAYASAEAINNGKKWSGYKLIEGRSNRKYTNKDAVATVLLSEGYSADTIYSKDLLGITAMENALGKKAFSQLLKELMVRPPGKPTLVSESDKHEAWNSIDSAKADFENVTDVTAF